MLCEVHRCGHSECAEFLTEHDGAVICYGRTNYNLNTHEILGKRENTYLLNFVGPRIVWNSIQRVIIEFDTSHDNVIIFLYLRIVKDATTIK